MPCADARDDPGQYCRIAASLLPRDLRIDAVIANVSAEGTLERSASR